MWEQSCRFVSVWTTPASTYIIQAHNMGCVFCGLGTDTKL